MSLNGLLMQAAVFGAMMPNKNDWQQKIDKVVDEYFNITINLPRKQKKKRKKELNSEYSFLCHMRDWKSFDY